MSTTLDSQALVAAAAEATRVVSFLIDFKVQLFLDAIDAGSREEIKKLLESPDTKIYVDVINKAGISPLVYAVEKDQIEIAEFLLEHQASLSSLIIYKDASGNNALQLAVRRGSLKATRFLCSIPQVVVALYSVLGSIQMRSLIKEAICRGFLEIVIKVFKVHKKDLPSYYDVLSGETLLINVIKSGFTPGLKALLELKEMEQELNTPDVRGTPAAVHALLLQNLEMLEILITARSSIDKLKSYRSRNLESVLALAAKFMQSKITEFLLEFEQLRDLLEFPDEGFRTPLVIAALNGSEANIKVLIDKGAKTNKLCTYRNEANETLLFSGVRLGNLAILKLLLAIPGMKRLLLHKNVERKNVLELALELNRTEILTLLIENHEDPAGFLKYRDSCKRTLLHRAVEVGGYNSVAYFINLFGFKALDVPDETGKTPLYIIWFERLKIKVWDTKFDEEILKLFKQNALFFKDIFLYRCFDSGNSILHTAIEQMNWDLVKFLLQFEQVRKLILERNFAGETPLILAALYGNMDIVGLLIQHGAEMSDLWKHRSEKTGNTVLMRLSEFGSQALKALLQIEEFRKIIKEKNNLAQNALWFATFHGHLKCFQILLEADPSLVSDLVAYRDKSGLSILSQMAANGHTYSRTLSHLFTIPEFRGLLDSVDAIGRTAILHAVLADNTEMMTFLLDQKACIEKLFAYRDENNNSTFDLIIMRGSSLLLQALFENQIIKNRMVEAGLVQKLFVSILTDSAMTPNRLTMAKILASHGATINTELVTYRDQNGNSILLNRDGNAVESEVVSFILGFPTGRLLINSADRNLRSPLVKAILVGSFAETKLLVSLGASISDLSKYAVDEKNIIELLFEMNVSIKERALKLSYLLCFDEIKALFSLPETNIRLLMHYYKSLLKIDPINISDRAVYVNEKVSDLFNAMIYFGRQNSLAILFGDIQGESLPIAITRSKPKAPDVIFEIFCHAPGFRFLCNSPNRAGETALQIAISNQMYSFIPYLVQLGAGIDELLKYKNEKGDNILAILLAQSEIKSFLFLLSFEPFRGLLKERNAQGLSLLQLAVLSGHAGVVRLLIEWGSDVQELVEYQDANGTSILDYSIRNNHHELTDFILDEPKLQVLIERQNKEGATPLVRAVLSANIALVKALIKRQAPVKDLLNYRKAFRGGEAHILRILAAECRADPEVQFELTQILLSISDVHLQIEEQIGNGETVLVTAALSLNIGMMRALIEAQASIDPLLRYRDREGRSVLMLAIEKRDINLLRFYFMQKFPRLASFEISSDAKPKTLGSMLIDCADKSGNTALNSAVRMGHETAIQLLLHHRASLKPLLGESESRGAGLSIPPVFKILSDIMLAKGSLPSSLTEFPGIREIIKGGSASRGYSPVSMLLVDACMGLSLNNIELILDLGVKLESLINYRDQFGNTILHRLISADNLGTNIQFFKKLFFQYPVLRGLLKIANQDKKTPLILAILKNQIQYTEFLMGLEPRETTIKELTEWRSRWGHNILGEAAGHCHENMLRFLLNIPAIKALAKIPNTQRREHTAELVIVMRGNQQLATLFGIALLNYVTFRFPDDRTILSEAAYYGYRSGVENLLKIPQFLALIPHTDIFGQTAVVRAAAHGHREIVQILVQHGATPLSQLEHFRDVHGNSILLLATLNTSQISMAYLLSVPEIRNIIDERNMQGFSPLLSAAIRGQINNFRQLLHKGANVELKCKGKSVVQLIESGPPIVAKSQILEIARAALRLMEFARRGSLDESEALKVYDCHNMGVSSRQTDDQGNTPIHLAALSGNALFIEHLFKVFKEYVKIDTKNSAKKTAVELALESDGKNKYAVLCILYLNYACSYLASAKETPDRIKDAIKSIETAIRYSSPDLIAVPVICGRFRLRLAKLIKETPELYQHFKREIVIDLLLKVPAQAENFEEQEMEYTHRETKQNEAGGIELGAQKNIKVSIPIRGIPKKLQDFEEAQFELAMLYFESYNNKKEKIRSEESEKEGTGVQESKQKQELGSLDETDDSAVAPKDVKGMSDDGLDDLSKAYKHILQASNFKGAETLRLKITEERTLVLASVFIEHGFGDLRTGEANLSLIQRNLTEPARLRQENKKLEEENKKALDKLQELEAERQRLLEIRAKRKRDRAARDLSIGSNTEVTDTQVDTESRPTQKLRLESPTLDLVTDTRLTEIEAQFTFTNIPVDPEPASLTPFILNLGPSPERSANKRNRGEGGALSPEEVTKTKKIKGEPEMDVDSEKENDKEAPDSDKSKDKVKQEGVQKPALLSARNLARFI